MSESNKGFLASDNEVDAMDRVIDYVIGDFKRLEIQQRYRTDPAKWAYDKLGIVFHDKQIEIGEALVHNRNVAVAAGHGTGKSFQAAILAAWWVDTHPLGTAYVATTAPTNDQISEIIFRELKRIHGISAERVAKKLIPADWGLPGRVGEDNTWKIERSGRLVTVMKGRKPPDNKAGDAFQGLHARYVLAIGDEATGLTEEMIDGLANITSGEHNRRFLISNPTNPYSYLGRIFLKPTGAWHLINVSVFDLPTFHGGGVCDKRGCTEHKGEKLGLGFPKDVLESISGPRFVKDKEREYGIDSARYKSRVLGQWAFESGNNLFTEQDMFTAVDCVVEPFYNEPPILGVDVARFGTDSTFIYKVERGLVMRRVFNEDPDQGGEEREPALDDEGQNIIGMRLRLVDSWLDAPLVTRTMPDGHGGTKTTMGTAEKVDQIARSIGSREVRVDASGLGSGVVDRLWELSEGGKHYTVVEMLGGANSPDRRSWYNQRAYQMDHTLRLGMFQGRIDIDPRDENLIDELMGVQYEYADAASGGGLKIESKESIKRRGGQSPDAVDAASYACADLSGMSGFLPGDTFRTDLDSVVGGMDRDWWFSGQF
jgi:hypothetical protein